MTILPRLRSLRGAGDDARLDEVDDGVREHLGVDPEVALVAEGQRRRPPGWRRSRAGASRRPGRGRRRARRSGARRRRSTGRRAAYGGTSTSTREVDVVDVDEAVAERPRHRPVELDDDRLRRRIAACIASTRRAERAEPVGVGRRGVDEDDIERQGARLEEARHVRQEDRDVVGAALVDRRAGVRPDEQRPVPEVGRHLGREVRPGALACGGGRR